EKETSRPGPDPRKVDLRANLANPAVFLRVRRSPRQCARRYSWLDRSGAVVRWSVRSLLHPARAEGAPTVRAPTGQLGRQRQPAPAISFGPLEFWDHVDQAPPRDSPTGPGPYYTRTPAVSSGDGGEELDPGQLPVPEHEPIDEGAVAAVPCDLVPQGGHIGPSPDHYGVRSKAPCDDAGDHVCILGVSMRQIRRGSRTGEGLLQVGGLERLLSDVGLLHCVRVGCGTRV
ncbi:MAG: hypothetical protein ACI9K2_004793, partial [Myxococcota bacterium]